MERGEAEQCLRGSSMLRELRRRCGKQCVLDRRIYINVTVDFVDEEST
jgi:hypothetical protein